MFFIVEPPNIREKAVSVSKTNLYTGILLSCCLHAVAYVLIVNVALQAPSPARSVATGKAAVLSLQLRQAPNSADKSAVTDSVAITPSAKLAKKHHLEVSQPTQKPPSSLFRQMASVSNATGRRDAVEIDPVIGDPVNEGQDADEKLVASGLPPAVEFPAPLQDPPPTADTQTIATVVTSATTGQMALSFNEASRLVSGAEETPWPDYPAIARRRGWEGTALIGILVSGAGELMDIRLLASSGKAVLDDAAVSALRAWRLPSAADAEPQWFEVPVEFALR